MIAMQGISQASLPNSDPSPQSYEQQPLNHEVHDLLIRRQTQLFSQQIKGAESICSPTTSQEGGHEKQKRYKHEPPIECNEERQLIKNQAAGQSDRIDGGYSDQLAKLEDQRQHLQTQTLLSSLPQQLIRTCRQVVQELVEKVELNQLRQSLQLKIGPIFDQFCQAYANLVANVEMEESIRNYSQVLVKYWKEQMFFQHFVENKYLVTLMAKIREHKYAHDIVKSVFECLEYLLKGLGSEATLSCGFKEEQFIYLLVMITKAGFITEAYRFSENEDWAYYVHFMKLLVRIINQPNQGLKSPTKGEESLIVTTADHNALSQVRVEKEQSQSKYLNIFFNQTMPQFPILLKLLHFYKWPDAMIQTSVKLCLLETSNHPNRRLQKYLINFPFVTFYVLYCSKVSDCIEKYLALASTRTARDKESEREEALIEEVVSDLKFLQDYLRVEHSEKSPKGGSIHKHLQMYINAFMHYIGRGFYQAFSKFTADENINGLVNGILLLIKVLKTNTVVKIKLGFEQMLHKYINCDLWVYLKTKRQKLDTEKYWIFDQCDTIIRQHSQAILFDQSEEERGLENTRRSTHQSEVVQLPELAEESKLVSSPGADKTKKLFSYSSIVFKAVRSYIPTTNFNWLYHEMKKMSQIFGIELSLNKQIAYSAESSSKGASGLQKSSFVYIMDQIQQYHYHGSNTMILSRQASLLSRSSSPIKFNPLLAGVLNLASRASKHTGSKRQDEGKKHYADDSQQLLYYYLVLLCSLKDGQASGDTCWSTNKGEEKSTGSINLEEICELLKFTRKCKSLMLVGIMYWYIKLLDYQLHESNCDFAMLSDNTGGNGLLRQKTENEDSKETLAAELLEGYLCTMQKLVYCILTEGWEMFWKHIRGIRKVIWSKRFNLIESDCYENANTNPATQFASDIFRDIDCDIVYFIMLRHIFGTRNSANQTGCWLNDVQKDAISKEIRIPCRLGHPEGASVYLVLDGQYVKFITAQDLPITKKPLPVGAFNMFYQDTSEFRKEWSADSGQQNSQVNKIPGPQPMMELVDKDINGQCYTVYFADLALREYSAKEIKWRKKATVEIEMNLRTIKFDIQD